MTLEFDPYFAKVLELKGYVPDADNITLEDVRNIKNLEVYACEEFFGIELYSLKGIEHFESLEELVCDMNCLSSLDVSRNIKLRVLYCFANLLTALDVSKNTELEELFCGENQLAALDVSNNPKLKNLCCKMNGLATLDVSKNARLECLTCNNNKLRMLDISENKKLTTLICDKNRGINGKFVVKAWFDNENIPTEEWKFFESKPWKYIVWKDSIEETEVTIEYQK